MAKFIALTIVSVFVPIVVFFLLRNLKIIKTLELENVGERKVPLMIQGSLLILILKMVFDPYQSPEMYYFFVGVLFSTIAALLLVFFKIKASLHQMGIAGVTMFTIAISVHFQINMLVWIGTLILLNGWVASSRIHSKSHTYSELIMGFFVGAAPQFLTLGMWL